MQTSQEHPSASAKADVHHPASPRFAWIILGREGYGVARATEEMAREFTARGVHITFVSIAAGPLPDRLVETGYSVEVLSANPAPSMGARGIGYLFAFMVAMAHDIRILQPLRRAILKSRAEWIHFGANTILPLVGMCAKTTGIPAYWHLHNTIGSKLPFGLQPRIYRVLCQSLGVVPLANSRHTAYSLEGSANKTQVLYPGIDHTNFSPNSAHSIPQEVATWRTERAPVFLSMARLVPEKAQDRTIEAAISLLRDGHDLRFALAGGPLDSPFAQRLKAMIENSGFEHKIALIGPVTDPVRWFAHCDVFVNSRTGAEPFGLSIIEAMLMRKPVIAYAAGGPSETVENDRTGWLINDPTVEGYRQGFLRALETRSRWKELGENARQVALSRYTVRHTVDRYLELTGTSLRVQTA